MVCWALASVQAILGLLLRMEDTTIVYFFYSSFTCLLIVVIVVTASYLSVWMKMKARNVGRLNGVRSQRERKLAKTLIIVTASFLISWLPFIAVKALRFFCGTKCLPGAHIAHLVHSTKLLHYGNSFVNPIIYSFRLPRVRFALMKMFCRRPNAIEPAKNDREWNGAFRIKKWFWRRGFHLYSILIYYNITTPQWQQSMTTRGGPAVRSSALVNGHCTDPKAILSLMTCGPAKRRGN